MTHWSEKYLGKKWSLECDCFGWFRIIEEQEFNRTIRDIERSLSNRNIFAARNLTESNIRSYRWVETKEPIDGDAALMSKSVHPHHIGIVALLRNKINIVHAPEFRGIMINDLLSLRLNAWKVVSYWTPQYED